MSPAVSPARNLSHPCGSVAAEPAGSRPDTTEVVEVLVDCDGCQVRGVRCGECVVSVLMGAPPEGVELDPETASALAALADGGLVPRLQVVPLRRAAAG